jgi:PAS domain S-box-containing protein
VAGMARICAVDHPDLTDTLDELLHIGVELLALERISVWQIVPAPERLVCLANFNALTRQSAQLGEPIAEGIADYCDALAAVPLTGICALTNRPIALAFGAGSVAATSLDVPVRTQDRLLGVLCIDGLGTAQRWTAAARQIASVLSGRIAQAILRAEQVRELDGLRHSIERYRLLVSTVYEIVWVVSARGEAQRRSRTWEGYTGQPPATYQGLGWLDAIHPDDQPFWRAAFAGPGEPFTSESRIRRKDGVYRVFQSRGIPTFNATGELREWVGCCVDITDRRRAEDNLWWSENRYRSLVDAMSQIVWSVTPTLDAQSYSESWYAFTGQTRDGSQHQGFLEMFHPDDRDHASEAFKSAIKTQSLYEDEYRLRHHSGDYRYIYSRGAPVRDSYGNIREWIGACTDITERKVAELALRKSEERLQRQNTTLMAIARSKLIGFDDLNEALHGIVEETTETLGVERVSVWFYAPIGTELICLDLYDKQSRQHSTGARLDAKDYPAYFAALTAQRAIAAHDAQTDPRTSELTEPYLRPLGIRSLLDAPIRLGEEIIGVLCCEHMGPGREWTVDEETFVGSVADLISLATQYTRRQNAERALQLAHADLEERVVERTKELKAANDKLKELDQLKTMFIASMSHELRTPLNSIIGFTGLILQELAGPVSDLQRDQLTRVYGSAKHLLSLITDVIDISKIEAGYLETHPSDVNVDELIDQAVVAVQPLLREKALTFIPHSPSRLHIHVDHKRMLQCVLNTLSNAVKYTEHGSISIAVSASVEQVRITIRDTGIGIRPEDLEKLFQPFERMASPLRIKTQGTGLGLYLTKKIMTEMLGGNIEASSKLGEGSSFVLTLPRQGNAVASSRNQ